MILVLLGTQNNQFTRLLEGIQECIENGTIKENVEVQAGHTKFSSDKMKIFDFISQDELDKKIDDADLIITHAGVGSIVNAVKKEKKVIAVPRLLEYGEHVNDHQIQIAETFSNQGLIKCVLNIKDLEETIKSINEFKPEKIQSNTESIIKIISDFIEKI